jgi:hypothetical protein
MRKTVIIFLIFGISSYFVLAINTFQINNKNVSLKLISKKYIAGEKIKVTFNTILNKKTYLIIHNTTGKSIISPIFEGNKTIFKIPDFFSEKAGILEWKLIEDNQKILNNFIEILPNNYNKINLESYFGPASITVGNTNFASFITIPLDIYDNPLMDGTIININEKKENKLTNSKLIVNNLIVNKNVYAITKTGKIFVSSSYKNNFSKEFETIIFPNQAQNFTINFKRLHDFADGNQTTLLKTSVITDEYGNIIQNGTQVVFIIQKNDLVLKTFGTTLNGIATAQVLHPEEKNDYSVFAVISGIARSNTINLNYKAIKSNIFYRFSNKNRTLEIGPITSYMNQLVQNGINVELIIYKNNKKIENLKERSVNGKVTFQLEETYFTKGIYNFEIKLLGNKKYIKNINL